MRKSEEFVADMEERSEEEDDSSLDKAKPHNQDFEDDASKKSETEPFISKDTIIGSEDGGDVQKMSTSSSLPALPRSNEFVQSQDVETKRKSTKAP